LLDQIKLAGVEQRIDVLSGQTIFAPGILRPQPIQIVSF
jgi:hypothetical protein